MLFYDASPHIIDCVFDSNEDVCLNINYASSAPVITGCVFSGHENMAVFSTEGAPEFTNCLFWGNGTNAGLSAIYLQSSNATFTNCTIVDNSSEAGTGGIYSFFSSPTIVNCIVRDNLPLEIGGGHPSVSYSNVKGGFTGEGNFDADPLYADPDAHDYRVTSGSPCIDAGDSTAVPPDVLTDLDDNPRFVDDPDTPDTGIGYPCVDVGAYEYQPEDTCPADINGDEVVDIDDLFAVLAAWGDCSGCPEDINEDGVVDIDDLFAVLAGWGPC